VYVNEGGQAIIGNVKRDGGRDNAGQFMLIHKASSAVLLGAGFTATLESILEFMDRERMRGSSSVLAPSGGSTAQTARLAPRIWSGADHRSEENGSD
jgi:hypothetical protein